MYSPSAPTHLGVWSVLSTSLTGHSWLLMAPADDCELRMVLTRYGYRYPGQQALLRPFCGYNYKLGRQQNSLQLVYLFWAKCIDKSYSKELCFIQHWWHHQKGTHPLWRLLVSKHEPAKVCSAFKSQPSVCGDPTEFSWQCSALSEDLPHKPVLSSPSKQNSHNDQIHQQWNISQYESAMSSFILFA